MDSYLKHYINGQRVDSIGGRRHLVISASTEERSTEITRGTAADVDVAVKAARKAFEDGPWSKMTATDLFPRDIQGLSSVARPTLHRLRDGDRLALEIAPVVKKIGDSTARMIAYNGSIPGPTLHVVPVWAPSFIFFS